MSRPPHPPPGIAPNEATPDVVQDGNVPSPASAMGASGRRTSIGARRNPASAAAVIAAARSLLQEKGYAGFSIDEVARRAGAGKPTIYRWWPTKADLFIAVYQADKAATIAIPDTGSLARDLRTLVNALWAFWRTTPSGGAFRALIAEAQTNPASLAALRDRFVAQHMCRLQIVFDRAVERGEIAPDNVEALVELYFGFNWFRLLMNRIDDDPDHVARAVQMMVEGARR
ncbi:TetR/AcrR family transcriptional regulator [Chelatococcus composti]|jgi:Transcriptional regulator|uniref:AcrR family transcriptional regulator n=1 Tax=Chelatococcus composti TaxID=1743235 RepID=A0A841K448_9HYPH|nr:TetR/AcrR family transcriptional regulator [Chelatococcus composti]MBB6166770.1 AcrR family transcriptional regulator [Chelatococcus composti]GGG25925.1 TetR family transcriptional regulator [Chelatococcus composti]